jgi:hypothetical protein
VPCLVNCLCCWDQPHTADVRALEVSQFQRAPATKLEMREAQETTRKLGRETVTSEIGRARPTPSLPGSQEPGLNPAWLLLLASRQWYRN